MYALDEPHGKRLVIAAVARPPGKKGPFAVVFNADDTLDMATTFDVLDLAKIGSFKDVGRCDQPQLLRAKQVFRQWAEEQLGKAKHKRGGSPPPDTNVFDRMAQQVSDMSKRIISLEKGLNKRQLEIDDSAIGVIDKINKKVAKLDTGVADVTKSTASVKKLEREMQDAMKTAVGVKTELKEMQDEAHTAFRGVLDTIDMVQKHVNGVLPLLEQLERAQLRSAPVISAPQFAALPPNPLPQLPMSNIALPTGSMSRANDGLCALAEILRRGGFGGYY